MVSLAFCPNSNNVALSHSLISLEVAIGTSISTDVLLCCLLTSVTAPARLLLMNGTLCVYAPINSFETVQAKPGRLAVTCAKGQWGIWLLPGWGEELNQKCKVPFWRSRVWQLWFDRCDLCHSEMDEFKGNERAFLIEWLVGHAVQICMYLKA